MELGLIMSHIPASVLLLTFNQQDFVQEALRSLLDQDYDPLEIIVSDDCSSDLTWDIIQQTVSRYSGPKKVILNQNEKNLGLVDNYFTAFSLSTGRLIFTAAGDDVSLSTRCSACISHWSSSGGKFDLVACDGYDMGMNGQVLGIKQTDDLGKWDVAYWALKRPFIFGASHMMTRRLLQLRVLSTNLKVEDQCLLFRSLLMGGAIRLAMPLVKHRRGGVSQTVNRWTYSSKREALINSARQNLLELDEMQKDAFLCQVDVKAFLNKEHVQSDFIVRLFEADGLIKAFNILISEAGVPVVKKLKYFVFYAFSPAYRLIFYIKNLAK